MTEVVLPGLSSIVTMNGRWIRRRRASASNIKMFHSRPDGLCHDFENEFAHLPLGVDFGLAEPSIVASLMHTLIDRKAVMGQGNAWKWRYKGRFVDGAESQWLSEEEARGSLTPLQQDVFHTLWKTITERSARQDQLRRQHGKKREEIDREPALKQHPVGTVIWREFADAEGNKKRHLSKVFDYKSPYRRVRYADGDREELNQREILKVRRTGFSQSGSP